MPAPPVPTEAPGVDAPLVVDADTVVGAARDLYDVFTGEIPTDEDGGRLVGERDLRKGALKS